MYYHVNMRDDERISKFKDYVLGKKLRLLHYLYEMLYSFGEYSHTLDNDVWHVCQQDEFGNSTAEIRGTEMLSVDQRIRVHSHYYKKMKPTTPLGPNGQKYLFGDIKDVINLS